MQKGRKRRRQSMRKQLFGYLSLKASFFWSITGLLSKIAAKKEKKLPVRRMFFLLLLFLKPLTALPNEKTYSINLHVMRLDDLTALIYVQSSVTTQSLASRLEVQFNSIVDEQKQRETYSLDHVLSPGNKPTREALGLAFKKVIKTSSQVREGGDLQHSSLEKTIKLVSKDAPYLHFVQHSDRREMVDSETKQFLFHREIKHGNPIRPEKSKIFFSRSVSHKTIAFQLNRWFSHAQQRGYGKDGRYFKTVENGDYQDFLLGTFCRTGIMEIEIYTGSRGKLPGLVFFDYHLKYALILEVLPLQLQQPLPLIANPETTASSVSLANFDGCLDASGGLKNRANFPGDTGSLKREVAGRVINQNPNETIAASSYISSPAKISSPVSRSDETDEIMIPAKLTAPSWK